MLNQAQSFLVGTVLPAALLVAAAYNAALMVNGPEGRRAETIIRADVAQARADLAEARARTASLASRADGLMLATLDQDLLEERLRARLGLTRPGEYMVRMRDLDRIAETERADDQAFQLASLEGRGAGDARPHRR